MVRFPVELIIFDDSCDDRIERIVSSHKQITAANIIYSRNLPSLGAIPNWNALIDSANGEYVLLLHHDEFLINGEFFESINNIISRERELDVIVADCLLCDYKSKHLRPHLPRWFRSFVIRYIPFYLYRRNVIGPTSCLIVRRDLYPRFDVNLKWLVDVDAYVRLRRKTNRWRVSKELKIGSVIGREDSITASIREDVSLIETQERSYLLEKYPDASVWLAPKSHWILNALESLAWVSMRVITRLYYWVAYLSRAVPITDFRSQRK